MCCAVGVCDVVLSRSHAFLLNHLVCHGRRDNIIWIWHKSSRFEKMYINILLASVATTNGLWYIGL
jgi:hypothetical protein